MKKRLIVIIILSLMGYIYVWGQNPARERLNAYKIAFFTKRMNLTSQEAERFWPVYNQYQDEKNNIQIERIEINRNFNLNELNMSEKDMTDMGDRFVELEVKEATLAKEFHGKIKQILPPVKVLRLYQAENQYRQQLLRELQERRQERGARNLN